MLYGRKILPSNNFLMLGKKKLHWDLSRKKIPSAGALSMIFLGRLFPLTFCVIK